MRALLYLLTLTLCCFQKNGYCVISYEDFINNKEAMDLVKEHYNIPSNKLIDLEMLVIKLKYKKLDMCKRTLQRYVKKMRAAGGGTPNFQASASGNPGSTIPNDARAAGGGTPNFQASASGNPGSSIPNKATEAGGGSRQITYKGFRDDPRAMALVERYNNNPISNEEMLKELEKINHKMCLQTLYKYLNQLREEKVQEAGGGVPNLPATQIAGQSYNFTSGNPGSSTSKGKSTNFSKAPGLSSHYGGTMPSQQAPPMYGTDVPSQAGIDSTNWLEENSQNDDGSLYSVVRPKNRSSSGGFYGTPYLPNQLQSTGRTSASNFFSPTPNTSNFNTGNPGASSHYGGAIPFQQAPMSGTLFPAFSNPFNQSAPFNSSTNSVSSQPGTPSLDWSEGNSQNDDGSLYSMIRPKRPSSSKGKSATKTGKKPRK